MDGRRAGVNRCRGGRADDQYQSVRRWWWNSKSGREGEERRLTVSADRTVSDMSWRPMVAVVADGKAEKNWQLARRRRFQWLDGQYKLQC